MNNGIFGWSKVDVWKINKQLQINNEVVDVDVFVDKVLEKIENFLIVIKGVDSDLKNVGIVEKIQEGYEISKNILVILVVLNKVDIV